MELQLKKLIFPILISLVFCLNASWQQQDTSNLYVVAVPVCDAPTKPITLVDINKSAEELYDELPYSPEKGSRSCYRAHQLLFNEVVEIFGSTNEEYMVMVSNAFYEDGSRVKQKMFCTLKQNLISLKQLKENGIDINVIPEFHPIDLPNQLILRNPWKDPLSGLTFSAGTRFIRIAQHDTNNSFAVTLLALDNDSYRTVQTLIPKELCITQFPSTLEGKTSLFIDILKNWADLTCGFIPYVSGGNSFLERYHTDERELIQVTRNSGEIVTCWIRHGIESLTKPHSGMDCSCLVLRAAQIAGIPYFCKNTTTLSLNLKPLGHGEKIKPGDLVWYYGHVLIIVDKEYIIESTGYTRGYGKVHMILLSKAYENINNCDDLLDAYVNNKPLLWLNAAGNVTKEINEFKIFRFS